MRLGYPSMRSLRLASLLAALGVSGTSCYLVPVEVEVEAREGQSWLIEPDTIEGGDHSVSFEVTNSGTEAHEVVMVLTDHPPDALPVENGRVGPRGHHPPNVEGLTMVAPLDGANRIPPGGSLTFEHGQSGGTGTGTFVLYCDVPGHYERGEYAVLTVEP